MRIKLSIFSFLLFSHSLLLHADEPTLTGFVMLSLLGKVKVIASGDTKLVEQVGEYLVDKGIAIEKAPSITAGPLTLDNIIVYISPRGISLTAEGTLFGKFISVTSKGFIGNNGQPISNAQQLLDIKNLNVQGLELEAKFKDTLSFTVFNKPVGIDTLGIAIDCVKPIKISSTINLFNQLVELNFEFKNDKKVDLSATLKKPVPLASMFPFSIGSLGNIAFQDISLVLTDVFDISTPFKNIQASSIKATTTLRAAQTVYPFANSSIEGLSAIGFKNFSFEVEEKSDGSFELQLIGEVSFFGHDLQGTASFIQKPNNAKVITVLEIDASMYAHIGQIIDAFKNTLFDNITLKNMRIMALSSDFTLKDAEGKDQEYKAGVVFEAVTQLSGPLSPLAKLAGKAESVEVKLWTYIKANPLESLFKIELPFMIPVQGSGVSIGNIVAEIGGLPTPEVALKTTVKFKVPHQADPLYFTSRIGVGVSGAILAGTLQGNWKNPLGLTGFTLSNVALQVGFAPGTPINSIGLAASMKFGSRDLAFATNIALSNPADFVLTASVDKITVKDFAEFIEQVVHTPIDTKAIPDIGFEKVRFYMCPKDTHIGEFEFKQGLGGSAGINVMNFKAFVEFSYMKAQGIIFEGYASKFNIGELVITGAGPDRKYNTPDDGPYTKLELTRSHQAFFLSGMIVLDPVFKSETEIDFEGNELSFQFTTRLNNVFEVEAVGKASLEQKEVYFMLDFKSDFIDFIQTEVNKGLTEFQKKAEKDLQAAQNKVTELNNSIADFDRQIAEKNKRIEELKKIIAQKTAAAQQKVADARADLENKKKDLEAQQQRVQADIEAREKAIDSDRRRDVDDLQRKVDDLQHQWDSLSDIEKAFRWVDIGIPLGAEKTALEVAKSKLGDIATDFGKAVLENVAPALANDVGFQTAQAAVNAAQKTLEGLEKVTFDPTSLVEAGEITKLGLEIGGLETGKAGAIASRESAIGILEGLKQVAYYGIGEGGKIIVKSLLDIIRITHIRAEVSAQDLLHGSLPKVTIDMVVLGQNRSLKNMQFRFGDPRHPEDMPKAMQESAQSIANAIVKFITG